MLKHHLYYFISFFLIVVLGFPLYLLSYKTESLVCIGLIGVYLLADKFLDALISMGKMLHWDRFAIALVGFFGVKNAFFFAFLGYLSKNQYLNSNLTIIVLALLYAVYSILIGIKMTKMKKE